MEQILIYQKLLYKFMRHSIAYSFEHLNSEHNKCDTLVRLIEFECKDDVEWRLRTYPR